MHNLQGNLQSGNFSHPDESTFPGLRLHGLELLPHNFSWLSSKHVPKKNFFNCVKTHVIIFSSIKNGPTLNIIDVSSYFLKNTSPSQAPESKKLRDVGCLHKQFTPSLCPSSAPINGLANTLSNFVAFSALTYSLGASNGCNFGS